jgi:FKBP-type peptidyl-prolyl cis-trans isomerase
MKQNLRTAIVFLMIIIGLSACKEDNYIDWKVKNELWLETNKTQSGIKTTESGLQYKILDEGRLSDRKPSKFSNLYVKYKGSLIDGTVFQATATSYLNIQSAVKGWQEALPKIHDGGSILIYIPSDLGYGKDGNGSAVPSHSTLIFQIDLIASDN